MTMLAERRLFPLHRITSSGKMQIYMLTIYLTALHAAAEPFIYTYHLPLEYTDGVAIMPVARAANPWTMWYDTDQMLHPFLEKHSTRNPEEATLFYIPIYTAQLYHSLLLDQKLSHQDSLNKTAEQVRRALTWVKERYPYWKKHNGLDHFMVMPLDHGRCSTIAGLSYPDFGDMFAIQASGDHLLTDFESHTWPCYQAGRDIVIPILTEAQFTLQDIVRPADTERSISILYRFVGGGRGEYGELRTHLLDKEIATPIPGSVSGWANVDSTHEDMKRSVFCVCPPGIAQHTLRVWRSIIFGCIPVTLFLANDAPYQHFLHLDYSKFSLNINPYEWHLLQTRVRTLLARPEKLREMQDELVKVQKMFLWDYTSFDGTYQAVLQELAMHPSNLLHESSH